jgi:MATE family multidrug resistance protein
MIFSLPGTIVFEAAKRILQAQGMFKENAYVLFVAAPINVFVNWLLVWKLDMGFIGAPIAVAFSRNLMALLIVLYIRFIRGSQCWGGLSRRAFTNWWPMFQLALPGMIMVEAEWLAFEIMTLVSSQFGTDYLAAQSILITLSTIVYHLPFALSVASSTRIANLIGANMVDSAKTAARVVC